MKRGLLIIMFGLARGICSAGFFAILAAPRIAAAHSAPGFAADYLWDAWPFTPDIVFGTLIAAVFYGAGLWRAPDTNTQQDKRLWHGVFFYAGLAAIFLALQSPIDTFSEHVFALHQVQHLLLHSLGPMLLMLAVPERPLIAGMPKWLRRHVLIPVITGRAIRAAFSFLSRPAAATFLYVGSLYFWQIPGYHEMTLLDESVHYLMHLSMLFTGLLFFRSIFDPRPAPLGTGYGARLVMLCAAIAGNILIGAFITFKSAVLYPAYDTLGRLWNLNALTDELLGGIVIWIPSSMMCVVAALIVIRSWGAREEKVDDWRRRGLPADVITASGPSTRYRHPGTTTRSRNRALALQLLTISLAVLAGVVAVVALAHFSAFRGLQ